LKTQPTQSQPKQDVYVAPEKKTPAVVNHIKQPGAEKDLDEASLATMRDYFAGNMDAHDPLKITQIRQFYDRQRKLQGAKPQPEHQKWNSKSTSGTSARAVSEAELQEMDLIINPAALGRRVGGFVNKPTDRTDHEVEMAKSDLYQAAKNAMLTFKMIRDIPEEVGIEGWVQEKIIKAADYLNTIREYLEGKSLALESPDGVNPQTKMALESSTHMACPECGGPSYDDKILAEEKDACYQKVKSRVKVWPSAYASGQLVQCRKRGAANWGTGKKK
jgi:hypothetical protein